MNVLTLVVDDEPNVEALFRQQSSVTSAPTASPSSVRNPLPWHCNALPMHEPGVHPHLIRHQHAGINGLDSCLGEGGAPQRSDHHDHRLWRCYDKTQSLRDGADALLTKPIDFGTLRSELDMQVERAA